MENVHPAFQGILDSISGNHANEILLATQTIGQLKRSNAAAKAYQDALFDILKLCHDVSKPLSRLAVVEIIDQATERVIQTLH